VAQGVLLNRSNEQASADVPLPEHGKRASTKEFKEQQSSGPTNATSAADHSSLRASVFQQAPGSLLIKASLGKGASFESGEVFGFFFCSMYMHSQSVRKKSALKNPAYPP
jgi:hypothetical protein